MLLFYDYLSISVHCTVTKYAYYCRYILTDFVAACLLLCTWWSTVYY